MPVEIRELVIKVAVADPVAARPPADGVRSGGGTSGSGGLSPRERQALIEDAVERVLEILAQEREP